MCKPFRGVPIPLLSVTVMLLLMQHKRLAMCGIGYRQRSHNLPPQTPSSVGTRDLACAYSVLWHHVLPSIYLL